MVVTRSPCEVHPTSKPMLSPSRRSSIPGAWPPISAPMHRDVGKLEGNFLAGMRAHHAARAVAVEAHDHPRVEVAGKSFAVEIITHT